MKFYKNLKLRTNNPMEASLVIKEALKNTKVIKITPEWYLNNIDEFYDKLTDLIGNTLLIGENFRKGGEMTGEKWLEIRYDHDIPDLAAYRHSKNAQPLHTDESYVPKPADIMFFYCINKASQGGATIFIDGQVLVDYLKNYDLELFNKLTKSEVRYTKASQSRKAKIIDVKANGTIQFNYNYYCIDKGESEKNKKLNQQFFDVLQSQVSNSYMMKKVVLKPGEAVAWWDAFVLHGRNAYKAEKTNDRFIWKTGIKLKM